MTETFDINITPTQKSRVGEYDLDNVVFGKIFADHMFIADYENGKWGNCKVLPYQNVSMSLASSALHYGQAIFEGMKAFKADDGSVSMFRPLENHKRLNKSAIRMAMPEVPEEIFMNGLTEILKLDKSWVPSGEYGSLYIRPFIIAADEAVGVRPSDTYKFVIFCCPAGKYYAEPVKVLIDNNYFRAVNGGVGYVKAAGNYGRSMYPTRLAQEKGFHQVIWTDALTHQYVEESGTMNLMFVIGNKLLTPALSDTILAGITRDSVLKVAKDWGYEVEEGKVAIKEILEAYENGTLKEVFGTGTAATIAHIKTIGYNEKLYELPEISERKFAPKVDDYLRNLRKGREKDIHNWMYKVV
jgi:branched-chain amino acid aminotransferase